MGSFFSSLGGALSTGFDKIGDVAGNLIDKASPLLETGLNYYMSSEEQQAAYDLAQRQAAANASPMNTKTKWIIGGGIAVVGLVAVLLSRRS